MTENITTEAQRHRERISGFNPQRKRSLFVSPSGLVIYSLCLCVFVVNGFCVLSFVKVEV